MSTTRFSPQCTCGKTNPHVVMRRKTSDGIVVLLWNNGAVTGMLGVGLPKVPLVRPQTQAAVEEALTVGRLMLDDVCSYHQTELPDLYRAAKKAARSDGLPGTVRRVFQELQQQKKQFKLQLAWQVSQTDSHGHVTERWSRLPLRWPSMYIFDTRSEEKRYGVFHRHAEPNEDPHDISVVDTGIRFRTLRELFAFLDTYPL